AWPTAARAQRVQSASSPSSTTPPRGAAVTTTPPSSAPQNWPARSGPRSTPPAARRADTRYGRRVPDWQPPGALLMRPSLRDSYDHRRQPAAFPLQRTSLMTRFVPVTVLVMLAASSVARADGTGSGSLPNGAAITFSRLQIPDANLAFSDATANTT